jgi:hypothetical protein
MVWTFRELLWWLLMTVLAAVVMSSLLDRLGSNDIQDLLPKRLRQTSPPQLT